MKRSTFVLIVVVIFVIYVAASGRVFDGPPPAISPTPTPSPTPAETSSPTPTPTPTPGWHLAPVRAVLWEDNEWEFLGAYDSALIRFLSKTLRRINLQTGCIIDEEMVQEVKRNGKVVELIFRFPEPVTISQWVEPEERDHIKTDDEGYRILEKVRGALFVLEDDSDDGLEAHILVRINWAWSCWAIRKNGSDELYKSWIDEMGRYLLTPLWRYLNYADDTWEYPTKAFLIDSHLSYGVFNENVTIIIKGRSASVGDSAVIINGTIRNDYGRHYYFAITGDLYTSKGEKLEGSKYIMDPPIGEFTVTYVPAHGIETFELHFKYEGRDIERYELFLALKPLERPPA